MNTKKALIVFLLGLVFLSPVLGLAEVKKEYYPNGKLRAEINYKNGKRNGINKLCNRSRDMLISYIFFHS